MDMVYLYQNTFPDLLLLIHYLIKNHLKPSSIKDEDNYVLNLFDEVIRPSFDEDKNILKLWELQVGRNILKIVYYVYLSTEKEKELIIYYFLLNSIKYGDSVVFRRNLKCVNEALRISKYVSRENHKMKGFLRFKEMKNHFFYAEIHPTNDILTILAPHFKNRLKNEYWVIKDNLRNKYCFYDTKNIMFLNEEDIVHLHLDLSKEEEYLEDLWKTFFKTIAIKDRENKKCQRNFMPKKYWKNIIEMESEL